MLKKDIKYEDFDGNPVTETFYFHLSQAELLRMEVGIDGGLEAYMQKLIAVEDGGKIMEVIERFITESVGTKSDNGRRFSKSPEIVADFKSSPAYDSLFMELCLNPDNAAAFLNGIIPRELAENVKQMSKLEQVKANVETRGAHKLEQVKAEEREQIINENEISDPAQGGNVFTPREETRPDVRTLTRAELIGMEDEELRSGLAEGRFVIGNE